ncbi:class I adenylate-forming enzyme family protein [Tepidibacillus marianensis]|uniref:class I adenylate-forming enzyme family protein n=1 Tax=Tepidibacillus marianensis TaxID=3131995 RepID=UPI0030CAFE48
MKWTWSELNQKANQMAHLLIEKGVNPKDHIAMLFSNQVEFVISFFAVLKTGATIIPLNVKLTQNEINKILQLNDVKALIYHPNFSQLTESLPLSDKWLFSIHELGHLYLNLDIKQHVEDISEILLTSGTTCDPKGVMLSHRAVYQSAMMMAYEMRMYTQDRILHLMPLTHSAPLNLMLIGAVFAGATSVLDKFTSPKKIIGVYGERSDYTFFWRSYRLSVGIKSFTE